MVAASVVFPSPVAIVAAPVVLPSQFTLVIVGIRSGFHFPDESLLSFKQSLNGSSNVLSSWDAKFDCCTWNGVVCSNLTGHVLQLHLQGNYSLGGKVNPALLNLKHLKYLDLSRNSFVQNIPSFIGSLTSLEYLNMSFTGFYGKIPHSIGNLSNLRTLCLETMDTRGGDYSGPKLDVDSLEWLSGLSKLEYLSMNHVNLSRATNWPQQVITKLYSLVELHLSGCNLNYMAPLNDVNNISHSHIAILDISSNYLDGESYGIIPPWIFQLNNLIYLDMSWNTLEGRIPTMSNTTKLQHIDLYRNNLNSSIPQWLYSCKQLKYVSLEYNNLQDVISNSISNLTSLGTLDLSENELYGKIPREIANLCNIQTLSLSDNKLRGEITDSFGNMSHCFLGALESLDVSTNQLSGHLPHQFGEFKRLRYLDLGYNSLSGVIPDELGNLLSIERLDLSSNKLMGNLPESLGRLANLTDLSIEDNMLEGVVTEAHFSSLSSLSNLGASRNHLTLNVNPNWIPPFKLNRLHLGSWDLGSSGSGFPLWLETQKNDIADLDLSCTGIYGNVPSWLWSLNFLNLSYNQLDLNIPLFSDPPYEHFYYLTSNNFSGPLPRIGTNVGDLDFSNNSLSGGLSEFFCNTSTDNELQNLNLGENHLSGELPDCFLKWQSLVVLNLGNNELSGRIPDSIGFLTSLESLNLYGNNFSGHVPSSLQNCTELIKIDFSYNNLGGEIPKWITARFYQLIIVILRSNNFSGEITPSICQLTSLQIVDLSHNRLSGRIPTCLSNLTSMTTKRILFTPYYSTWETAFVESASVATKGKELTYGRSTLFLVKSVDLSNNILSGAIPSEVTSLVELRTLNLSRNNLTGSIPDNIGNMKQLETLDFSMNSLSGNIPGSITSMSFLNSLNLSYNHLTGRIPESTQIRGLNESSFIGNHLCGPPLEISCKNDRNSPGRTHMENQGQEGNKAEIDWFYVFLSLGYAVGLSAVLTTLFLKKKWRETYYAFFRKLWDSVYVYCVIKRRRLMRVLGRN
ncbi:disease resistance family protein / LRR family protein [Striga hermonthica]|uniref:Disease resistance family protein / LRR family protein n=1 Tax=Striga hermonthica TaxID=68872 RepID=A0A9N7N6N7_STRHE|nr:disease resistance family protein / LRR family protein [Striga hermonthica]